MLSLLLQIVPLYEDACQQLAYDTYTSVFLGHVSTVSLQGSAKHGEVAQFQLGDLSLCSHFCPLNGRHLALN
jgi:hypothetical protein